jgi:hypothetical protein
VAITFTPASPRPVAKSYTWVGEDSENVAPFTLVHGSTVSRSCQHCSGGNAIIATNQGYVVNALARIVQ